MFKTDYMASLIASNLYDTALNAIEDCGKEQKINQIKYLRERTGGSIKFSKDIIEAAHMHSRPYVYDVIKTIYLAELNNTSQVSNVPEKKEDEEIIILFGYNDFPPYNAKSIEESYRVRELILNLDGQRPIITGIYKKIS